MLSRRGGVAPTPFVLIPESDQCWAHALGCSWEAHQSNEASFGHHPCTKLAEDELGLCAEHAAEILGRFTPART